MAFCYSYLRASKFLKTHLSRHSLRAGPEQLWCHSSPVSPPTSQVGRSLHRHFFCSSEHGWHAEPAPHRPKSLPFLLLSPQPHLFLFFFFFHFVCLLYLGRFQCWIGNLILFLTFNSCLNHVNICLVPQSILCIHGRDSLIFCPHCYLAVFFFYFFSQFVNYFPFYPKWL